MKILLKINFFNNKKQYKNDKKGASLRKHLFYIILF